MKRKKSFVAVENTDPFLHYLYSAIQSIVIHVAEESPPCLHPQLAKIRSEQKSEISPGQHVP